MTISRITLIIHIVPEVLVNLPAHAFRESVHFACILVAKIVTLARLAEVVGPWHTVGRIGAVVGIPVEASRVLGGAGGSEGGDA